MWSITYSQGLWDKSRAILCKTIIEKWHKKDISAIKTRYEREKHAECVCLNTKIGEIDLKSLNSCFNKKKNGWVSMS